MTAATGKRVRKTPAQRAEETLGVAHRRLVKAKTAVETARAALADAEADVAPFQAAYDYAAANPDLPQQVETVLPS